MGPQMSAPELRGGPALLSQPRCQCHLGWWPCLSPGNRWCPAPEAWPGGRRGLTASLLWGAWRDGDSPPAFQGPSRSGHWCTHCRAPQDSRAPGGFSEEQCLSQKPRGWWVRGRVLPSTPPLPPCPLRAVGSSLRATTRRLPSAGLLSGCDQTQPWAPRGLRFRADRGRGDDLGSPTIHT